MQGGHCRGEDAKNVQMLEYRRNRLNALRQKRWKKAATNCSNTIIDDSSPMLRSASVQTISGLDENYIENLQLLREVLILGDPGAAITDYFSFFVDLRLKLSISDTRATQLCWSSVSCHVLERTSSL